MTKKEKEFNSAKKIVNQWCKLNSIAIPKVECLNLHCLGLFKKSIPNTIAIDTIKCKISCSKWNSGTIIDNSITGTMLHELGHYVHLNWYKSITKAFKLLKEPMIHYLETDIYEDIAESIRLFIYNPYLLKEGRPKRYSILLKHFKPLKRPHFTQLLQNQSFEDRKIIYRWLGQLI